MKRPFEPPRMTNPSRALPPLSTKSASDFSFLCVCVPPRRFFLSFSVFAHSVVCLSQTPSGCTSHVSQEEKTLPTDSAGLAGEVCSGWLAPSSTGRTPPPPVCLFVRARKQTLGLWSSFPSTPSTGSSPDGHAGKTHPS